MTGILVSRPTVGCRRRCRRLVPSGSPRACGSNDPRTRVSSPHDAGMKKPFRRRARKGSVVTHRHCEALPSVLTLRALGQIQRSPKGSPGVAVPVRVREARRVAGQFNWLHRFQHHSRHPSSEVRSGRGGGTRTPMGVQFWRPPLSPLSYTSSANLNKKAASDDPGRLADLGLVVSLFKTSTSAPRRP